LKKSDVITEQTDMKKRESFCVRTPVTHSMMLIGVILVLFFVCLVIFAVLR
jgi:hypothetical protein